MAIPTHGELRDMSDEEVIAQYDARTERTEPGAGYWLDEMARRDQDRVARSVRAMTKWITIMTAVVMLATIANLGVFIYADIIHHP